MRKFAATVLLAFILASCNLGAGPPTATPDFPEIKFIYPEIDHLGEKSQQVVEGTAFDFEILAQDNSVGIERIELYIDGRLVQEAFAENPPVAQYLVKINWTAQDVGLYPVYAIAYRPDGTPSQAVIINIDVIAAP